MKELNTQPVTEFMENYRSYLETNVLRMPRSRIHTQFLRYQSKGQTSLGSRQTLHEIVIGHHWVAFPLDLLPVTGYSVQNQKSFVS